MSPATKKHGASVMHSAMTDDHGTPIPFVELARTSLGGIDLDPASSSYWNYHTVKASRFYDERLNGLIQPWGGRMFINPPGDKKGENVTAFWIRLIEHYRDRRVDSAVWVGFSLEQLTYLQNQAMHPLQFFTLIPTSRIDFLTRPATECTEPTCKKHGAKNPAPRPCNSRPLSGPPVPNGQPTHGNYITLLPTRASQTHARQQMRAFLEGASKLEIGGAIVRPA